MNIINDMLVDKCFPDNANARAVVPAYKEKTASGNPITLTDSAENKPLGMKLYGWSKQDGTPSPDNPVEIESAGMKWSTGKNLLDYSKMKSQTVYGVTLTNNNDGTFSMQGTCTMSFLFIAEESVALKAGTYTITVNTNRIAVKDNNPCVQLYNADRGVGIDVANNYSINGSSTKTFAEDIKLQYRIRIQKDVNYDGFVLKPMLNKGDTALPYEPYTGGVPKPYGDKVGVGVRGKNLFHITKESDCDKAYNNITKRIILPGEYLNGLSSNNYHIVYNDSIDLNTDSISFIYSGNSGYGVGIGTNCQKNKTYAFSFETNKGIAYAVFYDEDGVFKARVLVSKYNVFYIPDYAEHVVIVLTDSNSVVGDTIWFKNVQIEEAKSITAYEPYRTPQSTAIVTTNGLPGIPVPSNTAGITYTDANGQAWIADEVDLERRKYVQRVWKTEFDGNEKGWFTYANDNVVQYIIDNVLPANLSVRRWICNKLTTGIYIGLSTKRIYFQNLQFADRTQSDYGLSDFKANIAEYPLVVMTYLDTPIERDLTSAELAEYTQLYSYKPTTVVENDSDCWMDVTYKAGTSGKSKNQALRWYFKNVMPLVE